jgi:hypothetical protein
MYNIIDIRQTPYLVVIENVTLEFAIQWIDESGGDCPLCNYSIVAI